MNMSMKMGAYVISLLVVLLMVYCESDSISAKYYSDSKEIMKGTTNTDFVVSELLNNGYFDQSNEHLLSNNWDDFYNHYIDYSKHEFSDKLELLPAMGFIESILDTIDVLMINETHFTPEHRCFVRDLLLKIEPHGFKTIAVEALLNDPNVELFNENGELLINSGYYTKNFHFANLVNFAKRNEFDIISYEPLEFDEKDFWDRDRKMANNILSKLKNNEKLLIYCGWAHINNSNYWLRYMLEELAPDLRIKSINQVYLIPQTQTALYDRVLTAVNTNFDTPAILFRDGKPYTLSNDYDYEILYPKVIDLCKHEKNKIERIAFLKNIFQKSKFQRLHFYSSKLNPENQVVPKLIITSLEDIPKYYCYLSSGPYFVYGFRKGELTYMMQLDML